jgi:hypothetical protein
MIVAPPISTARAAGDPYRLIPAEIQLEARTAASPRLMMTVVALVVLNIGSVLLLLTNLG